MPVIAKSTVPEETASVSAGALSRVTATTAVVASSVRPVRSG